MDELRETLESAVEESEKNNTESVVSEAPPVQDAPPMDSSNNIDENPSDQQTEGVAPSDATEPVADDPSIEGSVAPSGSDEVKTITEVVSEQPKVEETPSEPKQAAPASWKGDAKKLWDDLPGNVKSEISRREKQTQQVLQDSASDRKRLESIGSVLSPHADIINANYGGDTGKAISSLLGVERALTSGNQAVKTQIVARIIQNYGIDLTSLDSLLAGKELPPEVKQQSDVQQAVNQAVAPLTQYIQQQQQREQQLLNQQSQKNNQVISDMANDYNNYPYFNEVREDMADIIDMGLKRGVEISLQEAYDKAVLINGRTATASATRESAQTDTQKALEAHQEAQRAKGASVSVSGNPSSTGSPIPSNTDDLRSVIDHAIANPVNRV